MKLTEMKIGTALILKKEKEVNDTIDESILEGEYFVEIRESKELWREYKLSEQPNFLNKR